MGAWLPTSDQVVNTRVSPCRGPGHVEFRSPGTRVHGYTGSVEYRMRRPRPWVPTSSTGGLARVGERSFVVCNEVEGPAFDEVCSEVRFSPDGQRIAYWAILGDDYVMVVDHDIIGRQQIPNRGERPRWLRDTPVFSPDGRHVAYVAPSDGALGVFVDGTCTTRFDTWLHKWISSSQLVFVSPTKLYTLAVRDLRVVRIEIEVVRSRDQ